MVALARPRRERDKTRAGVKALLARVEFINERMRHWTWQYAPIATEARRAGYDAIRYQDRVTDGLSAGRPDPDLLRAAVMAFEAMPLEARDRVEQGKDAGPFVPDEIRRVVWAMLGKMSQNLFDNSSLAEALCVTVGEATGVVDVELHGSDWAWGAVGGEEPAAYVYLKPGLSRGQVAAALGKVNDALCWNRWEEFSAGQVVVNGDTGEVKVMGHVVRAPGDGLKARDRRDEGKDAHTSRRKRPAAPAQEQRPSGSPQASVPESYEGKEVTDRTGALAVA
jgi:hypothetical protein